MLEMTWSGMFILGLLAIGLFLGFGWAVGAWLAGALLALLKRG
jgi:hypothetical protein